MASIFFATIVLLSSTGLLVSAADPDPVQDFCVADGNSERCRASVSGQDFASQTLRKMAKSNAPVPPKSFAAILVDVSLFPALNTMGLSVAKAELGIGGVGGLHTHPRSSELIYVEQGTVDAGFVDAKNTLYRHILEEGDMLIIPRGLLHYQYNVGKIAVKLIVVFNSQNPGVQITGPSLFASQLPTDVLASSLKLNQTTIEALRKVFKP